METDYDPRIAHTLVESAREPYVPVLSANERRAYAAAHRLLQLSASGEKQLACPGARRTAMVDRVAMVLMEEVGD